MIGSSGHVHVEVGGRHFEVLGLKENWNVGIGFDDPTVGGRKLQLMKDSSGIWISVNMSETIRDVWEILTMLGGRDRRS